MSFETEVSEADRKIQEGYLDLVVNSYTPLFDRIRIKAVDHMKHEKIKEIKLGIRSTPLVLGDDGRLYDICGSAVDLKALPRLYQQESESNFTLSINTAMANALYDLRESVKKSLVNVL